MLLNCAIRHAAGVRSRGDDQPVAFGETRENEIEAMIERSVGRHGLKSEPGISGGDPLGREGIFGSAGETPAHPIRGEKEEVGFQLVSADRLDCGSSVLAKGGHRQE